MKAVLRIPTDLYAYIEVEAEGTEQEIIDQYHLLSNMAHGTDKESYSIVDKYVQGKGMTADEYASLSEEDQKHIQWLKKANNRINRK